MYTAFYEYFEYQHFKPFFGTRYLFFKRTHNNNNLGYDNNIFDSLKTMIIY